MPTRAIINKSKTQKHIIQKLKKQRNVLHDNLNRKNEKLIELLGIACKYCNNLENHLKTKGYNRKNIENIKNSTIMKNTSISNDV